VSATFGFSSADAYARERSANGAYGIPTRPPTPEGWSPAAWRLYLDDADGGRSPVRSVFRRPPDTTPSFAEFLSREEDY